VSSHAAGLNLWWAQNDGMVGHVFLGPSQLAQLGQEMLAQGMAWAGDDAGRGIPLTRFEPRATVTVAEIDEALAVASPLPQLLADHELWRDWLDFLEGAAEHGGLVAG
jgi:hypothetical protein